MDPNVFVSSLELCASSATSLVLTSALHSNNFPIPVLFMWSKIILNLKRCIDNHSQAEAPQYEEEVLPHVESSRPLGLGGSTASILFMTPFVMASIRGQV